MPSSDRCIVAANPSGLGNRIKCIVNSRVRDPNARVYWPRASWIKCDFQDLFVDDGRVVDSLPEGCEVDNGWRLSAFPGHLVPEGFSTERSREIADGRAIDFQYNRIPREIIDIFLPHFQQFEPSPAVASEVADHSGLFETGMIGVHVRTWVNAPRRAYKYSIRNYFKVMDEYPEGRFFVASDAPSELSRFRARYGDRVMTYSSRAVPSIDRSQSALAEMLLLSRCRTLIASHASTFSEVAWWLGGAVAPVRVVDLTDMSRDIDAVNVPVYYSHKLLKGLKQKFLAGNPRSRRRR